MMYVILANGNVVHAPPASKCALGMELFMGLVKREGSTLVMLDSECSFDPKRFERLFQNLIK